MHSHDLRIRKIQSRLAALMDRLSKNVPSRRAAVGDQKQTTPSGWVLTWNPARPTIILIDDEKNGSWSDSALRYPTGKIAYDAPEKIPADVKKAVQGLFAKARRAAAKPKIENVDFPFQATLDSIKEVLEYLRTIPEGSAASLEGMIAVCEIQLSGLEKTRKQWIKLVESNSRTRASIWSYGIETVLPQIKDKSVQMELSRRLNKV